MLENFFNKIDTKNKAYWLGFIFADGSVNNRYISIELNAKDHDQLIRLCQIIEIDPNNIKLKTRKRKNGKTFDTARVYIPSKIMADDLHKYGAVLNKAKVIRLPKFNTRELTLAFLMGFFDGDGVANTHRVTSGSKDFLLDVKDYFNIQTKGPTLKINKYGKCYFLELSSKIFKEMVAVYPNSMPRKRGGDAAKYWRSVELGTSGVKKPGVGIGGNTKKKFEVDKETLQKLVWEMPTTKVASKFGVSDKAIEKRCKKLGINKPPRGYWAKQSSMTGQ